MNINKVFIAGRLTAKPEIRATPGGQSVTAFSVVVNRSWTTKDGKKGEDAQFFNVVFWGKQAEVIVQYAEKGQVIAVDGRLQNREWEKNGEKRRTTEIVGERFQFGAKAKGEKKEESPEDIQF